MFKSLELVVDGKLIRGDARIPDNDVAKHPVAVFFHGFCVDRIGLMRLHELFARACERSGIACVKFDFYGCGESDGEFVEMRFSDELVQAEAIYNWTKAQDWVDANNVFLIGHSLGGAIAGAIAPKLSPKAIILWAPGNAAFYDISNRVHAVPGHYKKTYDIGGLTMDSDFLLDVRRQDIVGLARGYKGDILLIHGECDEKVPVAACGYYLDMYGPQVRLEIIPGSNHQFSSVPWKTKVYDLSIDFLKDEIAKV